MVYVAQRNAERDAADQLVLDQRPEQLSCCARREMVRERGRERERERERKQEKERRKKEKRERGKQRVCLCERESAHATK